jgi:serine/threonine-protein kinase RsbW
MRMGNDGWIELKIESDLKHLEAAGNFLSQTMRQLGIHKPKDIFDVQLAVDEALTNIITHSYEGQSGGAITIRCKLTAPKKFTVQLRDNGTPFDPKTVQNPDVDAPLEDREIGGLGIYFIKRYIQTVKYAANGKENELTMTKILT